MERVQALWRSFSCRNRFLKEREAANKIINLWRCRGKGTRGGAGEWKMKMQTGPIKVVVPLEPPAPEEDVWEEEPTLRLRHRCQRRPRNPMPRVQQELPDLEGGYGVYVLANLCNMRTYVGCTNNWVRRLRQHCSFLKGGAKSTKGCDSWYFHALVTGFANRSKALSFEWYLQKYPRLPHSAFEGSYWPPTARRSRKIELLLEKFGDDRFPNLTVHHPEPPDRPSLVKEYWEMVKEQDPDEYEKWRERVEKEEKRKKTRMEGVKKGRRRAWGKRRRRRRK